MSARAPRRLASGPDDWKACIGRGAVGRCPHCGGGRLFRRWVTMVDRCPTCGHRFERRPETAFFLGAFMLNLAFVLVVLGAGLFLLIARLSGADVPLWLVWAFLVAGAVVVPFAGYPLSKTLWAGIEMAMHPVEPVEQAEADLWLADQRAG